MKRAIGLTVGAVALLLAAGLAGAQGQTEVPDALSQVVAESATVERGDLEVQLSANGHVRPVREASLTFGVSDVVSQVLVEEGQRVRAGDVLALLDTADVDVAIHSAEVALRQQEVRLHDLETPEREIDVAVAQAQLNTAQAQAGAAYSTAPSDEDLEIARLQTELARNQLWQSQLRRDMRLDVASQFREGDYNDAESEAIQLNSGIAGAEIGVEVNSVTYDRLQNTGPNQTALGSAYASIVRAQTLLDSLSTGADPRDLNMAALSLQNARLALDSLREEYELRRLVAPFDGLITENNLRVGELPPGGAALVLTDTGQYIVELDADEIETAAFQVGQLATITLDALPGAELRGSIRFIAPIDSGLGGVPTYRVEIALEPSAERIRTNMTATATVQVAQLSDVLLVPSRFITEREGIGTTVYLLSGENQIVETPVVTGQRSATHTEILTGVQAGDRIVRLR